VSVAVEIAELTGRSDPPGADVRYVVRNGSASTIWLVDDGWLAWRQEGRRIELCYARVRMQPGVVPFGYFPPEVVPLAPGSELERTASLSWPQRLSGLWNADEFASPAPGEYELAVRIGYGESPEPGPPERLGEGVEAPVMAWQREAVSEPARLVVEARSPA
jgi:hypothetical protein